MKYLNWGLVILTGITMIAFQNCGEKKEETTISSLPPTMKIVFDKKVIDRTKPGSVTQMIIGGGHGVKVCTAFDLNEGTDGVPRKKECKSNADFVVLSEQPAAKEDGPGKWEYDQDQDIWHSTLTFPEEVVIWRTGTYVPYAISEDGSQQVTGPSLTLTK